MTKIDTHGLKIVGLEKLAEISTHKPIAAAKNGLEIAYDPQDGHIAYDESIKNTQYCVWQPGLIPCGTIRMQMTAQEIADMVYKAVLNQKGSEQGDTN
ncbi:hypothetical protein [Pyramidobacter piscolens]|uniref:hypothetical protein n=1 Tax=Pyramidobacter piscolens TaxID=638849 RepID=UPI001FCBEC69|nr:hypothetical protein [Pyramidobacter piscolens]BDF78682.1 hypothetical protein CE91St28_14760 [Pyramidobacter piscolens]